MALVARTQPMPVAPRMGMLNRVLMQAGFVDPIEHFEGSFYGVTAKVDLNMRTRVADVYLNGVPLGGRISGTGWLKNPEAESGTVILEAEFERRLHRRFVSIYRAHLNRAQHTVTVSVKVPILGIIDLVLQ
jgi:hypothetical protein